MKTLILSLIVLSSALTTALAAKPNPNAPQGGVMNYNFDAEPENIHPIMAGDTYSSRFFEYTHDSLCANDAETWEFKPRLAEKWDVSKDGLSFTFFLRKDAFFHNGDPVTADDVKFSLDAIREPKHQALNQLPYFEKFTKVEVIDKHTIKFIATEKYFQNLTSLCGLYVIPKSVYGDISKSVKMQKETVGAGPYKLEKYDRGQSITITKFDKWYGFKDKEWKGFFNFDKLVFRFTKDDSILIERLKKGDFDYALLGTESFKKAVGPQFGKTVFANKVENSQPKAYSFIGFNFKNEILKQKEVRLALAHLTNREEMNKKFFNGWNYLATSPAYVKSAQAADTKPLEFSPKKAQQALAKGGWVDSDKDGVLDKTTNGKKEELRLTLIYPSKDGEKYWTMLKEDAKKAGIEITLRFMEWNSFIKAIDDKSFDMMAMGWGGGDVESDPKQIWHSTSNGKGGSNYISYSNPEVDKLIDEGRGELDQAKRAKIFKKVYTLIAEDVPYIFMFNRKYEFYANSNKVKKPAETFKYNFGYRNWWTATK